MDGFELIRKIRIRTNAAAREVPAAALTASARSEDRRYTAAVDVFFSPSSAFAMLDSAASSVLREVAMFIR